MGPGVAQECVETKDGPTIWEDHFYPEVINPETGEVVDEGEEGELVFTSLTKEAFPIIRYRTRDLTRLLAGTARPMRRFSKITGRSDDMMIIRGVNVFPSQIEELILKEQGLSPHYQIELTKQGNLDAMRVNVEAAPDTPVTDREKISERVQKSIKDYIGVTSPVHVTDPDTIPRSLGKAIRVVDKR